MPDNKAKTLPAHLWKPGQSGNPGGRPKGIAKQVRDGTDWNAIIARLNSIALDGKDSDSVKAAQLLFDRGFGKAIETVNLDATVTADRVQLDKLGDDELTELERLLDRIAPHTEH